MDTDTLWQILAVASFAAALIAAGALGGWALYRAGRDDEARAREDAEAWWDANVRHDPAADPDPPEPAEASMTPLPVRQPGDTYPGGWALDHREYPPGLSTTSGVPTHALSLAGADVTGDVEAPAREPSS